MLRFGQSIFANRIDQASLLLKAGELVAFPTETVYGLGADANNPVAVRKIFRLKGRPDDHPLIVHISGADFLADWVSNVPDMALRLADAFWPGPLTLILPKSEGVPDEVTGGQNSIGLRVPDHPVALDLLKAFKGGIAAPSANRFGRISPTKAEHVKEEFGNQIRLILDGGDCRIGLESTILSLLEDQPRILRPGMISAGDIASVIGCQVDAPRKEHTSTRVPGSLDSHYAPTTPCYGWPTQELWGWVNTHGGPGQKLAVLALQSSDICLPDMDIVVMPQRPPEYAQKLYGTLRKLDKKGYHALLVELPPDTPEWLVINNRLKRATSTNKQVKEKNN